MFKNALVSTSDKTGLIEFLRPLVANGLRVVSTGGTSKYLRDNGLPVVEVAEQTGFPEVMDGRVRTLHPKIHMALLARSRVREDMELLNENGLEPFDLVLVNLYPFEDALARGVNGDELIEYIDIGGPSLLRAAAKSHERIAVVCDPQDYKWILEKRELSLDDRRRLAAKVFAHTARYDARIASVLDPEPLENHFLAGHPVQELRYGENPHQKAAWFRTASQGLHQARVLHGKPLSYNNILDLDAACATVGEFTEPAACAVKHNNPCGVATHARASLAVRAALHADPVSVFGGIVAVNREVDAEAAGDLSQIFLECVIAPSFSSEALEILTKKKDLRLLAWPELAKRAGNGLEFRTVAGGYLAQSRDEVGVWRTQGEQAWQALGDAPNEQVQADLALAWKVCAHLKSNAIALAAGGQTVGLGMGQTNRVDAVEQAIARMKKHHAGSQDVVLASDAFFPFPDSVELAARAGIRWIAQPGGSIRDEAVLLRARELGVTMVMTKTRHFRH
ncbi:MAG: bifunctional phosphoribosylaminoimidazolecarboxamide formyltransferase/IMP cyclohydrolase [Bdellovibrionaceae bacterium]|nr:bifunctional phosphoribosylaminoimidazolecarboxamide formyltransferase/IMP cyclohydrolase [Pseudobdellovibrionaceae bacterium]